MRIGLIRIMLWSVLCFATSPLWALDVDGLSFPDELTVEGKKLSPNGYGSRLYSLLKIKVYSAVLYTPSKTSDAQALLSASYPRAILIRMRKPAKKEEAIKAWDYFITENCKSPCVMEESRKNAFLQLLDHVKEGDEECYVFDSNGLELQRNKKIVGRVNDRELSKLVLSGWIGPVPTTEALKEALLGK